MFKKNVDEQIRILENFKGFYTLNELLQKESKHVWQKKRIKHAVRSKKKKKHVANSFE